MMSVEVNIKNKGNENLDTRKMTIFLESDR